MPTISRVAFTALGRPIYWYGIIIALGIFAACATAAAREKKLGFQPDTTISLSLWVIPAALVCARIYYVAFSWPQYADNIWSVFDVRQGGMAIYGGILGGALAAALFSRARKISFWRLADLVAPGLALGQAIGRWGNFVNQEAYGLPVAAPGLQWFPLAVYIEAEKGWFLATFFYESAWCFLIFLALLLLERKGRLKKAGDGLLLYTLFYSFERALVEGLRMDSLYLGSVRISQVLSAALFIACAALLIYRARHNIRRPAR